jgi:hypothetical protein
MLFAEGATIVIDFVAAGAIGTTIAGAIIGHAKLIVSYLERKDADHRKTIEVITTQFREDLKENRAEVRTIVDRLFEGQERLFEGHSENREDIDRIKSQIDAGSSGVRRKPPSSGG